MAIYHFSAKVISRANGSSAVASAAYRSAARLHDERLDRDHDFSNKAGVVHSEVMLPEGAPEHLADRAALWNAVEAGEMRKDAQLSREVEFAIPRELNQAQGISLTRDFVKSAFVARGMIADVNVHWDIGADGFAKPHTHVMLTMREVSAEGFGAKVRDWNKTELVQDWREQWESHVNARLASLDIDARIDRRSLEAQGIDLEPQNKIGPAASRMADRRLEVERLIEHADIAHRNGDRIIASPGIALDAITKGQATFTTRDLAMFVHRHSDGKEQFDRALSAVRSSPELIELGRDGRGEQRFTSRDMIAVETRLERASALMAERQSHGVRNRDRERALAAAQTRGLLLSGEQRAAFDHVTEGKDLGIVVGYAGTGKSAMLGVAREAWEQAGYQVRGAALSGIAAENLEAGSAIPSRTIASLEYQWGQGRELLTARDVLVVDEAGMIGSRQMERVLSEAEKRGAKVVLVGDPEQLQAIEAGAAFRSIAERHGSVEITEIRRQQIDWQRDATRQLATGRTGEALHQYTGQGMVHAAETREAARGALIRDWNRERIASPSQSRIILTHTNDEVRALNELARGQLHEAGLLGEDVAILTERGDRQFATGDRLMFLRNDRDLGVKNGTLGTVTEITPQRLAVLLDDGRSIGFDTKTYAQVDHGYAATIHKSQGVTVDRAHVLATPGLDRHSAYVALSRHRDSVQVHYGRDDFADADKLARTLSRERAKHMVADYAPDRARDPAPTFAARREISSPFIRLPERVAPVIAPEPARGIFASFRPSTPDVAAALSDMRVSDLRQAVEGYARSITDIRTMHAKGLGVLPHQDAARDTALRKLNTIDPEAGRDLHSAFRRQPELIGQAANGNSAAALRAMALEAEVRTNPTMRADRFVESWQGLRRQREHALRAYDHTRADRMTASMGAMAKSLDRDAQVESILRGRKIELGLRAGQGGGIGHQLHEYLGRGRGHNCRSKAVERDCGWN